MKQLRSQKSPSPARVRLDSLLLETMSGEWGEDCEGGDGVCVLRTTNFTNSGVISYDNVVLRKIAEQKVKAKRLKPGDLIVEKSGGTKDNPVGRVVYFDCEKDVYLCNNFTQALRPDPSKIFPRFLFYSLFALYKMKVTERLYLPSARSRRSLTGFRS